MGRNTSGQTRLETIAYAVSSGADAVTTHAQQVAEDVKQAADPVRDAADAAVRRLAEQTRGTARTLTARARHDAPRSTRSWPTRTAVTAVCTLGIALLLWWPARPPEAVDEPAAPLPQPVPSA